MPAISFWSLRTPLIWVRRPGEDPGQHLRREARVERLRPERGHSRDLLYIGHQVDRQSLARTSLGQVKAGAVGEPEAEGQRPLARPWRRFRQRVSPPQPACSGEMGDQVQGGAAVRRLGDQV